MQDAREVVWRPGVWQLEVNLDDCPGQLVARALQVALEAGALDVWATPVTMKKGRPGLVVGALVDGARRDAVALALLAETTTIGVRAIPIERVELERALVPVETEYGAVRVKVGMLAGSAIGAHPEYEDCLERAKELGVAVKEVMSAAVAAYRGRRDRCPAARPVSPAPAPTDPPRRGRGSGPPRGPA